MNRSLLTPRLTPPGGSQPNASSIASASQSSIPGRTWEYVSSVIEMVAWPKSSCTNLTWTPRESRIVAHVCRRSWKQIGGNPARSRGLLSGPSVSR